jgi:hypothetical protein
MDMVAAGEKYQLCRRKKSLSEKFRGKKKKQIEKETRVKMGWIYIGYVKCDA